jgi:hypothetical protein
MQKWEYLTLSRVGGAWTEDRFDGRTASEKLTDLGTEGWELVSVCYDGAGYNFYLKRPVGGKTKGSTRKSVAKSADA